MVGEEEEAGLGQSGPFQNSGPRPGWTGSFSISPASFSAMYNAGDYAEGRSRPSGCLARCTYKGAIEMCSHSKSQGK